MGQNMNISEEVKKKIEEKAHSLYQMGTPEEWSIPYIEGAEFGITLMQEEVEKLRMNDDGLTRVTKEQQLLRIRGLIVENDNLIIEKQSLNQTIESQAKEIEKMRQMMSSENCASLPDCHKAAKKVEEQAKEIDDLKRDYAYWRIEAMAKNEQISQLKEALGYVRSTCYKDKGLMKDLDELLNPKK